MPGDYDYSPGPVRPDLKERLQTLVTQSEQMASLQLQVQALTAQKEQAEEARLRRIVREELAAMKGELVQMLMDRLRTELNLQTATKRMIDF